MTYTVPDALGTELYGITAVCTSQSPPYHYTIYPQTYHIKEIRIGRARSDDEHYQDYGTGEITYLCENEKSHNLIACSPIDKNIIGLVHTAQRPQHLYRRKEQLAREATIMHRNIVKRYRDVGAVTIAL